MDFVRNGRNWLRPDESFSQHPQNKGGKQINKLNAPNDPHQGRMPHWEAHTFLRRHWLLGTGVVHRFLVCTSTKGYRGSDATHRKHLDLSKVGLPSKLDAILASLANPSQTITFHANSVSIHFQSHKMKSLLSLGCVAERITLCFFFTSSTTSAILVMYFLTSSTFKENMNEREKWINSVKAEVP